MTHMASSQSIMGNALKATPPPSTPPHITHPDPTDLSNTRLLKNPVMPVENHRNLLHNSRKPDQKPRLLLYDPLKEQFASFFLFFFS